MTIVIMPPDQVSQLGELIAEIPDNLGTNMLYMQQYAVGLFPACRVAALFWESILPVGYILYEIGGHVNQIAVAKSARRKGVGEKLMNFALDRQTCMLQTLHVRSDNHDALSFYKALGFTADGEVVLERDDNEFVKLNRSKV